MKKIATILTIAIGLLLWTLNLNVNSLGSSNQTDGLFNFTPDKVELKETQEKTLDLPKIDLPSIFEAIFRSL